MLSCQVFSSICMETKIWWCPTTGWIQWMLCPMTCNSLWFESIWCVDFYWGSKCDWNHFMHLGSRIYILIPATCLAAQVITQEDLAGLSEDMAGMSLGWAKWLSNVCQLVLAGCEIELFMFSDAKFNFFQQKLQKWWNLIALKILQNVLKILQNAHKYHQTPTNPKK